TTMSPEAAIARAADCTPSTTQSVADGDPQGLTVGMPVTVHPDVDGGEHGVEGTVHAADANTIVVSRNAGDAGMVCVHFPRAGYRVDVS
ncbi:MAG: glutathione S-transferase family protein, partial [Pseudomonadota bacterium]